MPVIVQPNQSRGGATKSTKGTKAKGWACLIGGNYVGIFLVPAFIVDSQHLSESSFIILIPIAIAYYAAMNLWARRISKEGSNLKWLFYCATALLPGAFILAGWNFLMIGRNRDA